VFAVGADTVRAYVVPGHTAGSAAYLFRGVLFVGDAVTHTRAGGFAPARRGYSDDRRAAAALAPAAPGARAPRVHRARALRRVHAGVPARRGAVAARHENADVGAVGCTGEARRRAPHTCGRRSRSGPAAERASGLG
jgi:glyoxylase-like metal-dependent hydrolase (beta-lactamase superfamily II)